VADRFDHHPKNPLTDALRAITGWEPPSYTRGLYSAAELGDRVSELQDWCADHAKPDWATGLGVIEAAETLVDQRGEELPRKGEDDDE